MPAVSKKQQRFFGMVRAAQKGEGAASPEVAKVASEIKKKDAKDFASTKHKGLPMKKEETVFEGDVHSGQGEKIQKRTLEWMRKKGQKGAPGLDAMKARTAEHKAKRGVKEEVVDEAKIDDVKYSKDEKRKNYETDIHTLSVNKGVRADRNKRHSATDVAFKGHAATHRDRMQKHYKSRGVKKEEVTFEGWKEKAGDAIKKALKKKDAPKHDYGRDAGAEAAKRLRKKDHEKVNFLDPDD